MKRKPNARRTRPRKGKRPWLLLAAGAAFLIGAGMMVRQMFFEPQPPPSASEMVRAYRYKGQDGFPHFRDGADLNAVLNSVDPMDRAQRALDAGRVVRLNRGERLTWTGQRHPQWPQFLRVQLPDASYCWVHEENLSVNGGTPQ
jgi:hypothetical protein